MVSDPMIWMVALAAICIGCALLLSKVHTVSARRAKELREAELRRIATDRGGDRTPFTGGPTGVDLINQLPGFCEYLDEWIVGEIVCVHTLSYRKDDVEFCPWDLKGRKNKHSTANPWTIYTARVPVRLPRLSLLPESCGMRVSKRIGGQDIEFKVEEFGRRFVVRCQSSSEAHNFLDPRMIEFLATSDCRYWLLRGTTIVMFDEEDSTPIQIEKGLDELEEFVCRIPPHVVSEFGIPA